MKTESPIKRRVTRKIYVGDVAVGGDAPISVQSMTNTETCDVAATVAQVRAIQNAGADIVRVSVPSMEAAEAFRDIRAQVTEHHRAAWSGEGTRNVYYPDALEGLDFFACRWVVIHLGSKFLAPVG